MQVREDGGVGADQLLSRGTWKFRFTAGPPHGQIALLRLRRNTFRLKKKYLPYKAEGSLETETGLQ